MVDLPSDVGRLPSGMMNAGEPGRQADAGSVDARDSVRIVYSWVQQSRIGESSCRYQMLPSDARFDNIFDNNAGGCPWLRRHAADD